MKSSQRKKAEAGGEDGGKGGGGVPYLRKCFILSVSVRADPESSRIVRVNVRTGRSAPARARHQTRTLPAVELRGLPVQGRREARPGARARSPGLLALLLRAGGRPTPSNLCVTSRGSEPVQGGLARLKAAEKRVRHESCTLGYPGLVLVPVRLVPVPSGRGDAALLLLRLLHDDGLKLLIQPLMRQKSRIHHKPRFTRDG